MMNKMINTNIVYPEYIVLTIFTLYKYKFYKKVHFLGNLLTLLIRKETNLLLFGLLTIA